MNELPLGQTQIHNLTPYKPGMTIEELVRKYGIKADSIVKLASNENPNGMSDAARKAMEAAMSDAHRYPESFALRQALAAYYKVDDQALVLGNGSNDILDLIARVFLAPGTNSVMSQYAFGVYGLVTRIVDAKSIAVPAKNYGHDLEAMLAAIDDQTKVVWLANPNNPTGTFIPCDEVRRFIAQVPDNVIVVLDEAYYEYLADDDKVDTTQWLAEHHNLILVRTFSKIYGLAGLRAGYAITSHQIADLLNRVRQPFNVNHLAVSTATAALGDQSFVAMSRQQNVDGRRQLCEAFDGLGLTYIPSQGNFVTVAFDHAQAVHEALLAHGVIVRPLTEYGLTEHLRITVGTAKENARLIEALRSLTAG